MIHSRDIQTKCEWNCPQSIERSQSRHFESPLRVELSLIYDMIWYGMVWYDMMWYDMIWHDMTWPDMIWYDMIYDMIWYANLTDYCCSIVASYQGKMWCDPPPYFRHLHRRETIQKFTRAYIIAIWLSIIKTTTFSIPRDSSAILFYGVLIKWIIDILYKPKISIVKSFLST